MIGAIIGDVVGSRFEFNNIKTKDFTLVTDASEFTDDTVMTVAVMDAVMQIKEKNAFLQRIYFKSGQESIHTLVMVLSFLTGFMKKIQNHTIHVVMVPL